MRQHFAVILGVFAYSSPLRHVDKPQANGQHVAIGIHLGPNGLFHDDDTNENLEHK
jgi:hypothetical protein